MIGTVSHMQEGFLSFFYLHPYMTILFVQAFEYSFGHSDMVSNVSGI